MTVLDKTQTPKTAMILAAGLGKRMGPLTRDKPKALVEIAGKPLIAHLLDALAATSVEKIVINVHYKPGILREWISAHPLNERIIISDEAKEILDTGGGIKKALAHLGHGPFFAANCDSFFPDAISNAGHNPFLTLALSWYAAKMPALLPLKETGKAIGYDRAGDFFLRDNRTLERPHPGERAPFAYVGLQILKPSLFAGKDGKAFSLNRVYDRAIFDNNLFGVPYPGRWFHIGTPRAGL